MAQGTDHLEVVAATETTSEATQEAGKTTSRTTPPPGGRLAPGASTAPPPAACPFGDDAELEAAALALDQHSQLLQRDVLSRLLDMKRRAGERQAAQEAAGSQAAAAIAGLQHKLKSAVALIEEQREAKRRMSHLLHRSVLWRRHNTFICTAWRAWREHTQRWVPKLVPRWCAAVGGTLSLQGQPCQRLHTDI